VAESNVLQTPNLATDNQPAVATARVAHALAHSAGGPALALLVVFLVGLAVKEPEVLLPIGPDQGTYAYVAERILDGQLPYVDAWDNKPPGTYYLHAAVLALVPRDQQWAGTCIEGTTQPCGYLALQIADIVWTTLTALGLLAVARALGFTRGAAFSSTLLVVVFANVSQLSKEGNTPEKQLLLPMVFAYFTALRAVRSGDPAWAVVSAILAAVAFLFKQTAVSIPLALAMWCVWQHPKHLNRRQVIGFLVGYAIPIAAVGAYFASRGGFGALWEAAFAYNLAQAGTDWPGIPRGMLAGAWHVFTSSSALLWLVGVAGAVIAAKDKKLSLLVCWAVADAVSLGLGGAKFAQVYFVQLVPSLALLGGLAVSTAWQATRHTPALRAYAALVAASIFMLSSPLQAAVTMRAWNERTPGHSSTPTEHLLADRLLAGERGGPDQPIFIWGDNSEIYLYAGARAPGRFFQTFPLTRQYAARGFAERREELLRTWETSPPAIIALDPATTRDDPDDALGLNPDSFPQLRELLTSRYQKQSSGFEGWQVFRRIDLAR
jgi:Dolichyl-phosphate-mannose-protein mannosyltransferase